MEGYTIEDRRYIPLTSEFLKEINLAMYVVIKKCRSSEEKIFEIIFFIFTVHSG